MKSRERVIKALNHEEADRIPLDIGAAKACMISIEAYRNLLDYLGIRKDVKLAQLNSQLAEVDEEIFSRFGVDFRPVTTESPASQLELDIRDDGEYYWYTDEWQRDWRMPRKDGYYYDMAKFPLAEMDYSDYQWPDPADPRRFQGLEEQVEKFKNNTDAALVVSSCFGDGFLQMGAQLYGYNDWFLLLASEPEKAEKFLEDFLELKINYWDKLLGKIGEEIDVVCESDDLGTQFSSWISLDMYRKYIKPRTKELFSFIKEKADVKIFFHSCGSVYDFIPDLIEIGVDILNPVQVSAAKMDTHQLKKEFGDDLVFWGGGIDTQKILPYGTEEEIREEVKKRIYDLAPGGGFVFSTVHNIQGDVPPENIMAMLEAFKEFGQY